MINRGSVLERPNTLIFQNLHRLTCMQAAVSMLCCMLLALAAVRGSHGARSLSYVPPASGSTPPMLFVKAPLNEPTSLPAPASLVALAAQQLLVSLRHHAMLHACIMVHMHWCICTNACIMERGYDRLMLSMYTDYIRLVFVHTGDCTTAAMGGTGHQQHTCCRAGLELHPDGPGCWHPAGNPVRLRAYLLPLASCL